MTTTRTTPAPFVPADFDPSDFAHIQPFAQQLLDRPLDSPGALARWLLDAADLLEAVDEYGTRKSIDNACHTDDPEIEKAYLHYLREISPKIQPLIFEVQKKFIDSPHREHLTDEQFPGVRQLERDWQADVEIYREANIPLHTEEAELSKDYGKISGAMTVEFRGKTCTLQQLARFLEEPDRDTRREAWELNTGRRLQDRQKLDDLFDKLLDVRRRIAANAGFPDFRAYTWRARKRFDYTPEDCLQFGRSVEQHVVPLINDLDRRRQQQLGVTELRPWDAAVDPKGRPALRPFDESDIDAFVDKTRTTFSRFSPDFAQQFATLKEHGDLDLGSRPGKRPGGFQASLEHSRRPFIFMNAAGLQRDVETLLHEGGHAFHFLATKDLPLLVRSAPLEFCEVASMSMELLGCDHYDVFYGPTDEALRAKRLQLEGAIRILPWVATIDGFQHWLYTHPGHTRDERTAAWLELMNRFGGGVIDWTDHQPAREAMWQRQVHLYSYPFYYIEYAIAQLGALQVWLNYRCDPQKALTQLRHAFSLGGTRPLPELFHAAGVRFDFSPDTLGPLVEMLREELTRLD